jgi:light-regulated signal transduction histidine kinase (bacteriophytochrome)
MRILIQDLLQFSRTNKAEKVFEEADLNSLLENSKQELAQIIEDKKAVIENNELPILNVIPFQIQQLFTNLISNSLKYSKEDTTPIIKINCSTIVANEEEILPNNNTKYHKITVADNGIGFEQEYAKKIFILFNRLHNKNEYEGTGIGLAICKKIVENHKGFIFAKGTANEGATFTIYLPA